MTNIYSREIGNAYEYAASLMYHQAYDFMDAMFNAAQKFDVNQQDLELYYDERCANEWKM